MATTSRKSLTAMVANLAQQLAGMSTQLGQLMAGPFEPSPAYAPKTSASLSSPSSDSVAHLKAKSSRGSKRASKHEPIVLEVTEAAIANRMRLPAAAFVKGNKVTVDGHVFTQQAQDGGRSTKFYPDTFGDVEVGDQLVFTHVQGREWEVEIVKGDRKSRKAGKAAKPSAGSKQTSKAQSSKAKTSKRSTRDEDEDDDDEDEDEAPVRTHKRRTAKGKAASKPAKREKETTAPRLDKAQAKRIREFADIIEANLEDEDFEENDNIKATASFDGYDPRVNFTTRESQQFRSWRKREGLTFEGAILALNAELSKRGYDIED